LELHPPEVVGVKVRGGGGVVPVLPISYQTPLRPKPFPVTSLVPPSSKSAIILGFIVGVGVGLLVGVSVAVLDGEFVGVIVGELVGVPAGGVGVMVGVGVLVGELVALLVGVPGIFVGVFVGIEEGARAI
jgi:hypothetical protein